MLSIKNNVCIKILSLCVACIFAINSIPHLDEALALAPLSNIKNPDFLKIWKEICIANKVLDRVIFAVSEADRRKLKERNAEVLLLEKGQILASEHLKNYPAKLLRKIIHEQIEAILQIWRESKEGSVERRKYEAILKLIRSNERLVRSYFELFPDAPKDDETPVIADLEIHDLIARGFEYDLLISPGAVSYHDFNSEEKKFLGLFGVMAYLYGSRSPAPHALYFTDEFYDHEIRENEIRVAMASGFSFEEVASAERTTTREEEEAQITSAAGGKDFDKKVEYEDSTDISWISQNARSLVGKVLVTLSMEGNIPEFEGYNAHSANTKGGLGAYYGDKFDGFDSIGMKGIGIQPGYTEDPFGNKVDYEELEKSGIIEEVKIPGGLNIWSWLEDPIARSLVDSGNKDWVMDLIDRNVLMKVKAYKIKRKGSDRYILTNPVLDRLYTDHELHRFTQETLFGLAAYQFIKNMNIVPDILHLNEGHTVVAAAEMRTNPKYNKTAIVYTNHTLVEAGLQTFDPINDDFGIINKDINRMKYVLGQGGDVFCSQFLRKRGDHYIVDFSTAAIKLADVINAVSEEHATLTKKLFERIFKEATGETVDLEVVPVLNGSGSTWIADGLLYLQSKNEDISKEKLWEIHERSKLEALEDVAKRTGIELDSSKPVAWVVRRLVEYKSQYPVLRFIVPIICADRETVFTRESLKKFWDENIPELKGKDYDRLYNSDRWWHVFGIFRRPEQAWNLHVAAESMLNRLFPEGVDRINGLGMQLVLGGPSYEGEWVKEFNRWANDVPELKGKVVFVPGSDAKLLKMQAIGSDICITLPRDLEEACGTSEQRTGLNGGVNVAIKGAGPVEWMTEFDEKKGVGSGFFFGPYTKNTEEGVKADWAEFYSNAPVDILGKLGKCSNIFYNNRPLWQQLMLNAYRDATYGNKEAGKKAVTAEAMEQRYATDVYLKAVEKRGIYLEKIKEDDPELAEDGERRVSVDRNGSAYYEDKLKISRLMRSLDISGREFIFYDKNLGGWTIVAGSPHFDQRNGAYLCNWGRDTMISLPGLCLYTDGGKELFKKIFSNYIRFADNGILPNFIGSGENRSYNSVDATFWMFWAIGKYLEATGDYEFLNTKITMFAKPNKTATIHEILEDTVEKLRKGTFIRYRDRDISVKMDVDFLISAGDSRTHLTWMDAKPEGGVPVTSRHGKAVEINALWYYALGLMGEIYRRQGKARESDSMRSMSENVRKSFDKFWNEKEQCLYDTIDGNLRQGKKVRPNQIFAVSLGVLDREKSRLVVDKIREELLTAYGLRTLSPRDNEYHGRHTAFSKESSYHQGTVWPWLIGGFVEASSLAYGRNKTIDFLEEAQYFKGLKKLSEEAHSVPEIFNGACRYEDNYNGEGCRAQAWSVAEAIRSLNALFPMSSEKNKKSSWVRHAPIYEISLKDYAPAAWQGSVFEYIEQDLPRLKGMGIKTIWLMGLASNKNGNTPFEVLDPKKVEAAYGTEEQLRSLVKKAHSDSLGMRVITSLVLNDVSREEGGIFSQHKDDGWFVKEGKNFVNATDDRGAGYSWASCAQFNFVNPEVRDYLISIPDYWMSNFGIDGFVVDAPKAFFRHRMRENWYSGRDWDKEFYSVYPEEFLITLISTVRNSYPEAAFIAEYLPDNIGEIRELKDFGFDLVFDGTFAGFLYDVLQAETDRKSPSEFIRYLENRLAWQSQDRRLAYKRSHDIDDVSHRDFSTQDKLRWLSLENSKTVMLIMATLFPATMYFNGELKGMATIPGYEYHHDTAKSIPWEAVNSEQQGMEAFYGKVLNVVSNDIFHYGRTRMMHTMNDFGKPEMFAVLKEYNGEKVIIAANLDRNRGGERKWMQLDLREILDGETDTYSVEDMFNGNEFSCHKKEKLINEGLPVGLVPGEVQILRLRADVKEEIIINPSVLNIAFLATIDTGEWAQIGMLGTILFSAAVISAIMLLRAARENKAIAKKEEVSEKPPVRRFVAGEEFGIPAADFRKLDQRLAHVEAVTDMADTITGDDEREKIKLLRQRQSGSLEGMVIDRTAKFAGLERSDDDSQREAPKGRVYEYPKNGDGDGEEVARAEFGFPEKYENGSEVADINPEDVLKDAIEKLKAEAREYFDDKATCFAAKSDEYAANGESIILDADKILQSGAFVDMEDTIKRMRSRLIGGKIILYARDERSNSIVEEMLRKIDDNIDIEITTRSELEKSGMLVTGNGKNTENSSEAKEIEALIKFAGSKGVSKNKILAIVKGIGPDSELESTVEFVNEQAIPVIILGFYDGTAAKPHSFAYAMEEAIAKKLYSARNPGEKVIWYIRLKPIEPYSQELNARYKDYLTALSILQNA